MTLAHPTTSVRPRPATSVVVPAVGSYVDRDGARRRSPRVGAYVTVAAVPVRGSYTDVDGRRSPAGRGSYVRVER